MIRPFGEGAFLVEVDGADRAQAVAAALRAHPPPGVHGVVPGRASVLVEVDLMVPDMDRLERTLHSIARGPARPAPVARVREIPVAYGGEHGPDLAEVVASCGLSVEDVIARHVAGRFRVLFVGFAPGFAYLDGLDGALRSVRRLATPRTRTPAGSVAIADGMTGVYPADLPGGWRVIGRTPLMLFDPRREVPAYLLPGDTVRFRALPSDAWPGHGRAPADW